MFEPLTPAQVRVVGALAEKGATVPDSYPMTLNALRSACNQKSSRDPVTDLDEWTVRATLDELKVLGLVRFVYASHGARTTKYRHVLDERLDLSSAELALLTVLFLRGDQTVNELRVRTDRAHTFEDNDVVHEQLRAMASRQPPLVVELARRPGQKETRWAHLLGDDDPELSSEASVDVAGSDMEARAPAPAVPAPTVTAQEAGLGERVAELERRVAALESLLTDHTEEPDTPNEETAP